MQKNNIRPYTYQFLGRILSQFVGIGVSSVIVTSVGVDVFGQYSLVFALVGMTYGVLVSALNVNFQRDNNHANTARLLSTQLVVWCVALPVLTAVALFANFSVVAVLFISFGILLQHATETLVIKNRIMGEDERSVLPRLLPVIVFLFVLYTIPPSNLETVALMFSCSWLISLLYLCRFFSKIKLSLKRTLKALRGIWPIWLSLVMTQAYGNFDLYVIRLFHSDEVVGTYRLAYTFASMAMPIAGVFSFVFLTQISAAIKEKNIKRTQEILCNQLIINLALGLGLVGFTLILFPAVADFLYGAVGASTVLPARVLAIALSLNMLTMVFSYTLLALHQEKSIAVMTGIGAVFYIISSFLLVPKNGAVGAGIAMTLTYLLLLIGYFNICRKKMMKQVIS